MSRESVDQRFLALVRGERRGPIAALLRVGLLLLSWPVWMVTLLRNWAYDHRWRPTFRAAVPVISVGNLTFGGTGKTPCVEWIARYLTEMNMRPVILSRGYGASEGVNDEALVLDENLPDVPHLQSPDRVQIAMTAVEELDAELLILDDGFQHRRLERDLDIVLIDATRPIHQDWLFPRGTLREPTHGLRRAHLVMLTRCDLAGDESVAEQIRWLRSRFPGMPIIQSRHEAKELIGHGGVTESVELLRRQPVAAMCGIGNPAAFYTMLAQLGASVIETRTYRDHHLYTRDDVDELARWASQLPDNAILVTTQKDWVKLQVAQLGGRPLWAVRIGLRITDGEAILTERLHRIIAESDVLIPSGRMENDSQDGTHEANDA